MKKSNAFAEHDGDGAEAPMLVKASLVCRKLSIGRTLLRELHTNGCKNFDRKFPQPFRLTKRGALYFDFSAIELWVRAQMTNPPDSQSG
ncbi:putative DNA-binding transcriptional regulator AlpA [Acidovorax soli]|uniref:Putative DNA-binding transcriptional regulator AlpA n=1 Tax=Acidovorax soli TaxID=592050 RepID=A0A7X0U859_9BURK|nr:hypothetical protein [Acidovorax soli]MBB6558887.1 putative DNA-binding transcriptional regulator AlpA [Acidovorax soli]